MTSDSKPSRSWLRLGCVGMAVAGLALVAWALSLFGAASTRAKNEVLENRMLVREIAEGAAPPPPGRVVLDLVVGEFYVRRGEPGEPVTVEAEFDRRSYDLLERFEAAEDGGWIWRLTFEETNWFPDAGLRALFGGSFPTIAVTLPPDVPLAFEGRFGKGHASLELGGLWLTDVDVTFDKGALRLGFDRPLVEPIERIAVRTRQGGALVYALGNASPREVEIDHSMGGMTLDLSGEWSRDADVRVSSSMGGATLRLPDDVAIEGLPGRPLTAPRARPEETPPPTVRMSVSSLLGGVDVVGPDR